MKGQTMQLAITSAWKRYAAAAILAFALALSPAAQAADVTVSGTQFLQDGKPWIAEGVVLVGLLAPVENFARPAYASAYRRYGPDLLTDIRAYGADTVRLKVSETGLDPQSPFYKAGYRDEVLGRIKDLRKAGFIVIVSMLLVNSQRDKSQPRMASAATNRAWETIIGDIGKDRGIMLEIVDEPSLQQPTPENWETWQTGMQGIVDTIRRAGSQNVILLDGLRNGKVLEGAPAVNDPTGQIAYAVHPYLTKRNRTQKNWEDNWGRFARTHPTMATEWNALSDRKAQCEPDIPTRVAEFFGYLRELRMGLVIWAFDLPGVKRGGSLTNFKNFECGSGTKNGAGEAVRDYFLAH
jgi:endoglucanase